jgi:hypothetical protein
MGTLISSLLASCLVFASGEKIPCWSINTGGNVYSSSTNYKLCGSLAQSVAGKDSSGSVQYNYAGFWNPWIRNTASDVKREETANIPEDFSLSQNYPNPFNPSTVIEYSLPQSAHVTIEIYNLLGQKINILVNEDQKVGFYRLDWDGKDKQGNELASGVYFYRIQAGDFVKCKKMTMLK